MWSVSSTLLLDLQPQPGLGSTAPRELNGHHALLRIGAQRLGTTLPPPPPVYSLWSLFAWMLPSAVRQPLLMMSTCTGQAKWFEMMFVYSASALPNGRTRQRLMKKWDCSGSWDAESARIWAKCLYDLMYNFCTEMCVWDWGLYAGQNERRNPVLWTTQTFCLQGLRFTFCVYNGLALLQDI